MRDGQDAPVAGRHAGRHLGDEPVDRDRHAHDASDGARGRAGAAAAAARRDERRRREHRGHEEPRPAAGTAHRGGAVVAAHDELGLVQARRPARPAVGALEQQLQRLAAHLRGAAG